MNNRSEKKETSEEMKSKNKQQKSENKGGKHGKQTTTSNLTPATTNTVIPTATTQAVVSQTVSWTKFELLVRELTLKVIIMN